MTATNIGADRLALLIGSDISGVTLGPTATYCYLATGSAQADVTQQTLETVADQQFITGSPDFTETRKVTLTFDWSSLEASGISLTQFGLTHVSGALTGSVWTKEAWQPATIYAGTKELQVQTTIEVKAA